MILWLTDYTDFHNRSNLCSSLPAGLASPTACAKAIDACAKACASAKASATRGQRRRTVAQAARMLSRQEVKLVR